MRRPIDRTVGILAALDYLGLDFGHMPVIGRHSPIPELVKRRPRRWLSLVAAFLLKKIL